MKDLIKVEHKDQLVLTTEQLAEVYECSTDNIKKNFNVNQDKFIEGKHYYVLKGSELAEFKNQVNICYLVHKQASQLYLWTKQGASRHCKMLGTDKAWEQFDVLEETYFNQNARLENLSPQLQLLINIELEQKAIKQKQEKQAKEIQGIREVVALSPNDWRKDTSSLIRKMAQNIGDNEHIKDLHNEAYSLLNERMGVDLQCRLTNKRRRMADEGICKSKRDKLNPLDVIAEDKKLIEGYIAIIKELSIKYGIGISA